MAKKIDIDVGISGVGEKSFAFRLSPLSKKFLGELKVGTPSQVVFSTEIINAKLKDLGKLRLRTVIQMLTGKKKVNARFRTFNEKKMRWLPIGISET